ncbi:N-glycosidase YbiA [Geodia barretti]|uniref:N-glycosidase YbiA n=1 Tax=Geodia barretti TaxID=519541 RepID=A0AA35RWT8_GEOBA|nr:N-glycosidase YbiA [Geodia barretti]
MSWMSGSQGMSYSSNPGSSHVPPQPTCRFPGCARPCYVESYGRVHDFCGRTHANEFARHYGRHGASYSLASASGASAQRKKPTSTTSGSSSRQPMKAVYQLPGATGYGASRSNQIRFYNRDEPYYEFTNFYPTNVFIDGKNWPTTEHYFQAQKFVGTPYVEKIRRFPSPRDAFQLSRDPLVSRWRRSDWESVKDDIMLKALRVKFSENVTLRDKLRSTGEKELVEHTSNDSYWGDGGNGLGQNKLGKLLMQVRRELKEKYGPYTSAPPYHFSTRDDSSISHRATSTHTTPRLRRSSSFSNISSSRPSYAPAANPSGGVSGSTRSYMGKNFKPVQGSPTQLVRAMYTK